MTLRCAVCSEPVGMLRITRTVLRLGHLREPHPIHPVQLARSATASLGGKVDRSLNERLDTGREDVPASGLSQPSGQGVLASVHPPGSAPRPALSAGSRST